MKIGFFTEAGYQGTPTRNVENMRTDLAWVCALGAIHHPIQTVNQLPSNSYDIGICIIPKKRTHLHSIDLIKELKRVCGKVINMQEGCHWEWMDDEIEDQIWWFNQIVEVDMILCHNDNDVNYFKGISGKPAKLFQTLMITDLLNESQPKQDSVMIHGNWCMLNRGFDSYMVAREFDVPIYGVRTGKFRVQEDGLDINYLDWMPWVNYMRELSKHKYGVHFIPASAGQFPLNCSFLGIPCIGFSELNAQRILHPDLTVDFGDIHTAKKLAKKLKDDKDFYNDCSEKTKYLYNEEYSEKQFIKKWNKIVEVLDAR